MSDASEVVLAHISVYEQMSQVASTGSFVNICAVFESPLRLTFLFGVMVARSPVKACVLVRVQVEEQIFLASKFQYPSRAVEPNLSKSIATGSRA